MKPKEIFEKKSVHVAILAITAILIYAPSWHYEMYPYFDDGLYVLNNEYLGFSLNNIIRWLKQPCIGLFVPVTMFSFMFDYNLWGLDTLGYHLQNTFWFIITIIAVYACFIKLKFKPWQAFILVLIYTVHPQRVESVVWITERKDVLSGALFFIALFFYLDKFDKDKFNFLTFFIYIIALFAKPMAITLPVVLAMIDFSRKRQFSPKYYIKRFWPYALVIIAYLIIIMNMRTDFVKPQPDYKHMVLVILFNIYWYTKTALAPAFYSSMNTFYPKIIFDWQAITQMLLFYVLLAGSGIIIFLKAKKTTLLYSILPWVVCYLALLSPVLGGFCFSSPDYSDRYNYIPSVFILFAAGCVVPLAINQKTRKIITLFIAVYIASLAYSTIKYLPYWKNNTVLFSKSCEKQPANITAVISLAVLEIDAGNYDKAIALSERLGKDYLNNPSGKPPLTAYAGLLYIKGSVLFKRGYKDKAFKIFHYISRDKNLRRAVFNIRGGELFYSMLADCYLRKSMPEKAISCFKEITKLKIVSDKSAFFYKGMIALLQNKKREALGYFEKANQLDPEDKNIEYNLRKVRDSLKQKKLNKHKLQAPATQP